MNPAAMDWPDDTAALLARNPRLLSVVLDSDLGILNAGPSFARLVNTDPLRLIGRAVDDVLGLRTGALARPLAQLERRGEGFVSAWAEAGGGRFLGLTLSRCADGRLLMHGVDLSNELQLTEELRRATDSDDLTGLLRKGALVDEMSRARAHGISRGLLVVDLDHFKRVNDSAGHPAGDILLRAATGRLVGAVGDRDSVARIGGDEFAVYIPRAPSPEAVGDVGESVVRALEEPFEIAGRLLHAGCSVGAVHDATGAPTEDLFADADAALYRAKETGRGRVVVFDERIAEERERRRSLEEGLRRALSGDEIESATQGIFRLADLSLHSLEVFALWRRPGHGLLAAGHFINTASELGVTQALTEAALQHAAGRLGHVALDPGGPSLAINIEPPALAEPDFAGRLDRILAEADFPPERVTLEVTEREPIPLSGTEPEVLRTLARRGFGIAIDDFGSGASSLGYFADLPVTQVKIDRSLTSRVGIDERVEAVVSSLIDLAARLGLEVVAEGIETESQLEVLRAMGCPLGQGFLLERPRPLDVRRVQEPAGTG